MSFLHYIGREQNKSSLEEMKEEVPDKSVVSLVHSIVKELGILV